MKLLLLSIALCAAVCVASTTKILASSSHQLNRREINSLKRLFKRQAYNDPSCNRRDCAVPNCGKDFVAATLPGECCERCVPWEYARSLGIRYPTPQPSQDNRDQQRGYDPYNQQSRAVVYIYGPDDGARVSSGQSIYFDCEVDASNNQYAQPRWTRSGSQPLPYKAQSTALAGNRKIVRLTIPDATQGDAGRYECSAGTGNPSEQTSIDLQVTEGGYYPPSQPRTPPPSQYPGNDQYNRDQYNRDPYNQDQYNRDQYNRDQYNRDPYNQPGYYPGQPQVQTTPPPPPPPQPQPDDENEDEDEGGDDGQNGGETETTPSPPSGGQDEGGEDEGEYSEDYTENDK